jgi:ribosomal protein S18 acetylase RimI-like enzyme
MVSGAFVEGGTAELISLWVAPGVRGRGVGDRLVRTVIDWADAQGARHLALRAFVKNDHALRLYRRNGFGWADPVDEGQGERVLLRLAEGQTRPTAM